MRDVGDCRQPGQGFEFLGYRFEAGERHMRKKSPTKLKESIRVSRLQFCKRLECYGFGLRKQRVPRGWPQNLD